METLQQFARYQELQAYVGWTSDDAARVRAISLPVKPELPALVEDFYEEIERHPAAQRVITGGVEQIERLKGTLVKWLQELLSGQYDAEYVARRWRVGYRHVEIGLDQVYTNVALSRLRTGLIRSLEECWQAGRLPQMDLSELTATFASVHKLLDLDLALIEDAYQSEHLRRMQQSERLVTIGKVAGGIAHELRNPLNVIKTSVYYLLNARAPNPQKTAEHLGRIERQVGLADDVITALSDFAKLPLPILKPFDVASWIGDVLELLELPPNICVNVSVPAGLPSALADRCQLSIVLSNLIRNARDAMPAGGNMAIRVLERQEHIEVNVEDSGTGIPPHDIGRIMEPLYSTKARGIGLGLAMAKALVEKNEGRLAVTSEVGQGSTFTIQLRKSTDEGSPGS